MRSLSSSLPRRSDYSAYHWVVSFARRLRELARAAGSEGAIEGEETSGDKGDEQEIVNNDHINVFGGC